MSKFHSFRKRVSDLEKIIYSAKEEEKTPAWFLKALNDLSGEEIELLNEAEDIRVTALANGKMWMQQPEEVKRASAHYAEIMSNRFPEETAGWLLMSKEEEATVMEAAKLLTRLRRKYDPSFSKHAPKYEEG